MLSRHLKLKFSLLQCTYWCSVGAFSSFAINYLQTQRGVSAGTAGTLLAVFTCVAFAGQFFWGRLCDRWKTNRKVFIITNFIMLAACFGVFFLRDLWMIFLAYGLLGFVQSTMPAVLDSWILKTYADNPQAYGPIRSSASFVYAIFTFFFGSIISRAGYGIMLVFVSVFVVGSIVVAFVAADAPQAEIPAAHPGAKGGMRRLLTGQFSLVLVALLCMGMSGGMYTFMAIIMNQVGGSVDFLGYTMFASAMCQVPFMLFSRKMARFSPKSRLLFAGCIYAVTLVGMALAKTPLTLVLMSLLSGAGFGIILPALRELVETYAPADLRTTAQSVSDAVNVSLAGLLNSLLISALGDTAGVSVVLFILAGVQIIGFIPLLMIRPPQKQ
ncbi:MAG: MFS transporter [Eubacteriales bacterium]|nr:MFS transporter [Eubacteriales bacterium]